MMIVGTPVQAFPNDGCNSSQCCHSCDVLCVVVNTVDACRDAKSGVAQGSIVQQGSSHSCRTESAQRFALLKIGVEALDVNGVNGDRHVMTPHRCKVCDCNQIEIVNLDDKRERERQSGRGRCKLRYQWHVFGFPSVRVRDNVCTVHINQLHGKCLDLYNHIKCWKQMWGFVKHRSIVYWRLVVLYHFESPLVCATPV